MKIDEDVVDEQVQKIAELLSELYVNLMPGDRERIAEIVRESIEYGQRGEVAPDEE